jgi:hypothetical protein
MVTDLQEALEEYEEHHRQRWSKSHPNKPPVQNDKVSGACSPTTRQL